MATLNDSSEKWTSDGVRYARDLQRSMERDMAFLRKLATRPQRATRWQRIVSWLRCAVRR